MNEATELPASRAATPNARLRRKALREPLANGKAVAQPAKQWFRAIHSAFRLRHAPSEFAVNETTVILPSAIENKN